MRNDGSTLNGSSQPVTETEHEVGLHPPFGYGADGGAIDDGGPDHPDDSTSMTVNPSSSSGSSIPVMRSDTDRFRLGRGADHPDTGIRGQPVLAFELPDLRHHLRHEG